MYIYCQHKRYPIIVHRKSYVESPLWIVRVLNLRLSLRLKPFSLTLSMNTSIPQPILIFCLFVFQIQFAGNAISQILHVGPGQPFETLNEATDIALPGDTILVHEGIYSGGLFVGDLQGTASDWIYIYVAPGAEVIFEGGNNAWQFTDGAYLHIRGFIFQHQAGNGLNFDDGGSYETPTHHILFDDCTFRDMNASGNNDLLKLSGLDSFEIRNCLFMNGAAGGSGIDMVGCHDGLINNCHFENLGSNSIQAKGGTRNIRIEANYFKNGGARAVNLGGSTGLQFFRPIDAPYEAAELKVYSNIFIGSEAPIAFVGTINTEVINNTFYLPGKWVMRILQETVDETRFPPCGYNAFRNNIIYLDDQVNVEVNIGPNTAPETFTFSNNLWFHSQDAGWSGPDLPSEDEDNIVGEDPLFIKGESENFDLLETSPAIGNGYSVQNPVLDFSGMEYLATRSIGAYEGGMMTFVKDRLSESEFGLKVYPNPFDGEITIEFGERISGTIMMKLLTIDGRETFSFSTDLLNVIILQVPAKHLPNGVYYVQITIDKQFTNEFKLVKF